MRLVRGVGFNDGKYKSSINGKDIKESHLWRAMLQRCYDPSAIKRRSDYSDCYVSENFKSYSYFYEWCQNQIGFNVDNFSLDKDLLVKGNRVYSEENCLFLPTRINVALSKGTRQESELPIGVYFNKNTKRFVARCSLNGKTTYIASSLCPIEAFNKYKSFKEDYLKLLANEYKDAIDPRAYNALMNYTVEITD